MKTLNSPFLGARVAGRLKRYLTWAIFQSLKQSAVLVLCSGQKFQPVKYMRVAQTQAESRAQCKRDLLSATSLLPDTVNKYRQQIFERDSENKKGKLNTSVCQHFYNQRC